MKLDAEKIIRILELEKHPREGGYFRETYRDTVTVSMAGESWGADRVRSVATAIYYLLTDQTFSEMHRLPGQETFHHYAGNPVEMLLLYPDGSGEVKILGSALCEGQRPQITVPPMTWQGSRVMPGGEFALMGTTMGPGFDYRDYCSGKCGLLTEEYPAFSEMIRILTRE